MIVLRRSLFPRTVTLQTVIRGTFVLLPDHFFFLVFETFLPPQVATVFEHIPRIWMEAPEGPFTRLIRCPGHFDETIVERQGVSDGVLPSLLVLTVEREQIHDKLIDFA